MYQDEALTPTFSRAGEATTARYTQIPDGSMLPETAYRIVRAATTFFALALGISKLRALPLNRVAIPVETAEDARTA